MNRLALCAFVGVLCFYGTAATFCAPDQYNTGYTLIMNEVTESGHWAIDFTTNQLAANTTGWSNDGGAFTGTYVYTGGQGYWIDTAAKTCYKSNPPMNAFMTQCLKSDGDYTPVSIGQGTSGTLYKYSTTANATAVLFTSYPELPVSYQFLLYGGPGVPGEPGVNPWMQQITYMNTEMGANPSLFVVPSYCQQTELAKPFHEVPIHKSIQGLLWAH